MKYLRLIILAMLLFTVLNVKSQVYVNLNATGLNNGTSWVDAYRSLDTALLNTNSNEIWVAKGVYIPTIPITEDNDNRKVAFFFKPTVACFGGFDGYETSKDQRNILGNPTVLSGDIGEKGVIEDNAYHIIYNDYDDLDTSSVYDGFIITGAYGGNGWTDGSGGGIYLDRAGAPVIRNCIIINNNSSHGGGFNIDRCDPIIEDNLIANNEAWEGAGILLNYSDALIRNNKIVQNTARGGYSALDGGGIAVEAYSSPEIVGNLIANNEAGDQGGGIRLSSNYDVNVFDNLIINNVSKDGGGIYVDRTDTNLINNIIVKNKAHEDGGGIYMDYTGDTRLINNTISLNISSNGGGLYMKATNTKIINNILYNNKALLNNIEIHNDALNTNEAFIYIGRADWRPEFTFNIIEGELENIGIRSDSYSDYSTSIIYQDNMDSNPMFLDTLNNDFQVDFNSSAVDGGILDTTGLGILPHDFFSNPRIFNDRIDIGAIEYNGSYNSIDDLYDLDSINSILTDLESFFTLNVTSLVGTKNKEFEIYPNPFKEDITINTNSNVNVSIYNINGTLLFSEHVNSTKKLNLSSLKSGVYILKLDNGIIKKLIKTD